MSNPPTRVSPRARPVAGAPVDALLKRCDELARRWAAALVLASPLGRMGELELTRLAREAPILCGQVSRALASEDELELIAQGGATDDSEQPRGARGLAAIAGARDAQSAVAAAEALRGVMWEALLEELPCAPARDVIDLGDRLACVCASALAAALAQSGAPDLAGRMPEPAGEEPARPAGEPQPPAAAPAAGVLIDEREEVHPRPGEGAGPPQPAGPRGRRPQVHPFPWEPPPVPAGAPIAIRDERREEGPAAWMRSIGHQLERFARDRLPFAVLLLDVGGVERVSAAGVSAAGVSAAGVPAAGLSSISEGIERVLAGQVHLVEGASEARGRPAGTLTREGPGRYWLLVTETDALAARRLAESLVGAIRSLTGAHRPRLEVTVGTAVCPDDGRDAAALAACADMGVYEARRAGRSIASVDGPA